LEQLESVLVKVKLGSDFVSHKDLQSFGLYILVSR